MRGELQGSESLLLACTLLVVKDENIYRNTTKNLDFKNNKKMPEVMFLGMWKYLYSESVLSTLYIKIKHKCWKISFGQNKRCKKPPTYHSFTFNFWFLYELKHIVHLSKTVCVIFHFRFCFVFITVYIFVQQNAWTFWL